MLKKFLIASAAGLLLAGVPTAAADGQPRRPRKVKQLYVVYFKHRSIGLGCLTRRATIAQAAANLQSRGGVAVAVKGHADRVGDQGMNLRLSLQRTAGREGRADCATACRRSAIPVGQPG